MVFSSSFDAEGTVWELSEPSKGSVALILGQIVRGAMVWSRDYGNRMRERSYEQVGAARFFIRFHGRDESRDLRCGFAGDARLDCAALRGKGFFLEFLDGYVIVS